MRRLPFYLIAISSLLVCFQYVGADDTSPSQVGSPELKKLAVPGSEATSIATRLSLRYRDMPGVKIAPDVQNHQLVVMAPKAAQQSIAKEVQQMLAMQQESAHENSAPLQTVLTQISWREFEDDLQQLSDLPMSVTTSSNGVRASFQLTDPRMSGTTIAVDRQNNLITVNASASALRGWKQLIRSLDQSPGKPGNVIQMVSFQRAEPEPIQKAIRLLRNLKPSSAKPVAQQPELRNAVFQEDAAGAQTQGGQADGDQGPPAGGGAGLSGDPEIQIIPELGQVIIKGTKRDAQRIMDLIKQIEEQSKLTKPDIEVVELSHADANAVTALLQQLYDDVLSARQGEVSITSLDAPNALLLIGRKEAIAGLKELIVKIDQPIAQANRLRVFRLQNASAVDAEQTIRDFFTDRPGTGDDLRPGVGTRVRVLADYRTNSLIVSAAPRDMLEVTRLVDDLDVQKIPAQSEIKIFQLNNAVAEELAPVLQEAISGSGEGNGEATNPSTSISIVSVGTGADQVLDSGVLSGAIVTADTGANAIVVRAPAASMPLIGELIRQLDKSPGVDSLVKVFTIENGDATQLTTALQDLFGADASTQGTSVGGANLAGLPSLTAAVDSSLVPLRFSTDQRTNSIVASGSAEDLEVVESILLRLDSEGFAERITEVIWLRHQGAQDVATAIQTYVQQRTQTVNTIQQFQQGLGPYDLPDRDLIVVAEPVSNSVLLSVSPRLYEDVRRMIDKLDRRPPMVMIQVLMAEVRLDDAFEIGGEFGLQDSLLFDRGVTAAALGEPSTPGFNFNNIGHPNANSFQRGTVGTRGVSSFGLGTTNSALGYGGFVLSAASDSVSMLLRTLQDANRLQILSRPQINTMDNTEARVQVGRTIARVTDIVTNVSNTQVVTEDIPVGLILIVRPRVGSDGLIIMDIDVTRSDRDSSNGTLVPAGDGSTILIDDILETTAQSVVAAYNGQTVVFGGLIQKVRTNFSRRVPFVSDIPLLGYMFKYEQETEVRNELLLVLTPMLISGQEDLDYIKEVESSRMSWCLADVVEAHGDVGLSGGYGLWGPAIGNTIYPDLHPTVEQVMVDDRYLGEGQLDTSYDQQILDQSSAMHGEPIMIDEIVPSFGPSIKPSAVPRGPLPTDPTVEPIGQPPVKVDRIPSSSPQPQPSDIPQSRFEPLETTPLIQQTSFPDSSEPNSSEPAMTKRANWMISPWRITKPSEKKIGTPRPIRLGGIDDQ